MAQQQQSPDVAQVYLHAVAFEKSADTLFKQAMASIHAADAVGPQQPAHAPTVLPAIVLGAFAIELYLKAIGYSQGMTKKQLKEKGHQLEDLFYKLPQDIQKRIRDHAPPAFNFVPPSQSTVSPGTVFDKLLHQASGVFEQYRYAFEGLKGLSGFGRGQAIMTAAKRTLLDLRPDLEQLRQ